LLADEMGVGKTLQVLALLWTLLRQSPAAGGAPALRRAVVVCPASLVRNWKAEAAKWLGVERLGVLTVEGGGAGAKAAAASWANKAQAKWPLLIVGYEALRAVAAEVASGAPGLLICDEAHRLKSGAKDSKTLSALLALKAPRRVLLSGTPVQNNLDEFFAMMHFATPGLLGDAPSFRRNFSGPVAASRDASASAEAKRLGAERGAALNRIVAPFMLRRTADVNNK
jgi:DNA repair and recombination protein RAD54B